MNIKLKDIIDIDSLSYDASFNFDDVIDNGDEYHFSTGAKTYIHNVFYGCMLDILNSAELSIVVSHDA